MKDQNIFSKVINLKIPITFSLHNVWILLGQEIWEGGGGLFSGSVWFWNFYGISSGNTCR